MTSMSTLNIQVLYGPQCTNPFDACHISIETSAAYSDYAQAECDLELTKKRSKGKETMERFQVNQKGDDSIRKKN